LAELLAIVGAQGDHDDIGLLLIEELRQRFVPVVEVLPHQAGPGVGAVDHGEFRLVGEFLVEAPGEAPPAT
jgi:hypothetical protein